MKQLTHILRLHAAIAALLALVLHAMPGSAQIVSVGAYSGVADATTKRVLVTLPADAAAAANDLPETFEFQGETYTVATTSLPLVYVKQAPDINRDSFTPATLTLIDPDEAGAPHTYNSQLRYRGATAQLYTKKNYAVKLLDDAGEALDASLLGMRSDNSWILDAMASDNSRMRNRVSTDLWLDFSRRPYYADAEPTMTNGTHGRFVEAFVDDRYWGLYCLTEKVDRKQLRVKKFKDGTPRGIIYKSFAYDNMTIVSEPEPSNDSYVWQGWEGAYPDVRKGEPFDWKPLLDLYLFLGQEVPSFDLLDHLHQRLDIPVWRDYIIFCDLLHADDNVAKNIITYYPDITAPVTFVNEKGKTETVPAPGPLGVCPWDLDATWGRDFLRQPIEPTDNCNVSNAVNYHLWVSQFDQGKSYYTRWAELRESIFTPANLWAYFERYFDLFAASGAAARETERWNGVDGVRLDFDAEAAYIRRWIGYRLGYLDGDYDYVDTGISAPSVNTTPDVYTLDGRRLDAHSLNASSHGVYIMGGRKVIR